MEYFNLDLYLQIADTPFFPEISYKLLNDIIRDLGLERKYILSEAISNRLANHALNTGGRHYKYLLWQLITQESRTEDSAREALEIYFQGYIGPLELIYFTLGAMREGESVAKKTIEQYPDIPGSQFVIDNLQSAVRFLVGVGFLEKNSNDELAVVQLLNDIAQKEYIKGPDLYYGLGLEAARITFPVCMQILDTLLGVYEEHNEDKPKSLYSHLVNMERSTVSYAQTLSHKTVHEEPIGELIKNFFRGGSYTFNSFLVDIQDIQKTNLNAKNDVTKLKKLLDKWGKLSKQIETENYPALWAAIQIKLGDIAERLFVLTKDKKYLKTAINALLKPFRETKLSEAELGGKVLCGRRLEILYINYASYLEMKPIDLIMV